MTDDEVFMAAPGFGETVKFYREDDPCVMRKDVPGRLWVSKIWPDATWDEASLAAASQRDPHVESVPYVPEVALTTAQARIAELEAALEDTKEALRVVTWNRDVLVKNLNLKRIDGPEFRALEAKP